MDGCWYCDPFTVLHIKYVNKHFPLISLFCWRVPRDCNPRSLVGSDSSQHIQFKIGQNSLFMCFWAGGRWGSKATLLFWYFLQRLCINLKKSCPKVDCSLDVCKCQNRKLAGFLLKFLSQSVTDWRETVLRKILVVQKYLKVSGLVGSVAGKLFHFPRIVLLPERFRDFSLSSWILISDHCYYGNLVWQSCMTILTIEGRSNMR